MSGVGILLCACPPSLFALVVDKEVWLVDFWDSSAKEVESFFVRLHGKRVSRNMEDTVLWTEIKSGKFLPKINFFAWEATWGRKRKKVWRVALLHIFWTVWKELDPPPWLNRMREMGYPPGYLDPEEEEQPSGITIYADEEVKDEQEDGEILETEYLEPQRKMSVEFPGINAPIPKNADERRWAAGSRPHRRLNHSYEPSSRRNSHEQRWSRDYRDDGPCDSDMEISPPGLVTHQGMVALTLVTLPTVQEVTFRDLEALILGGLYLTEVGGALWSMKIH
ncbi:hypothetical protein CK203_087107 [Vitis vinifera]|uniref:PSP proline-rich domain-containing protein n=1 Tax=Vitis vinifera TaxID=29760 RepID=A0A438EAX1_VITVI|nr:hypothetical protein CK203_087107 [Vitis vinifera]